MTPVKTHSDYSAFLESLKVKNEGPEEMHGYEFNRPIDEILSINYIQADRIEISRIVEYLAERCRRAESNAKPETLAEGVKAFMRAGMDAQKLASWDTLHKFRRLSEPGK